MTRLADTLVTDSDLADLAGCSARYVRRLATDGHIQRVGRNTFLLGPALQGVIAQMSSGGGSSQKLLDQRIRKLAADADLSELALAKAKGEVAPIAEFERVQTQRYRLIQVNMLNVPSRVSMKIVGSTDEAYIKDVLRDEITSALKQSAHAEIDIDNDAGSDTETLYDDEGIIE